MPVYEAVVDEEGRLILPREIADKVGARPGDRLDVAARAHDAAKVTGGFSLRILGARGVPRRPKQLIGEDLGALKDIARLARHDGARRSSASDAIGDFLLEEDRRSRGR